VVGSFFLWIHLLIGEGSNNPIFDDLMARFLNHSIAQWLNDTILPATFASCKFFVSKPSGTSQQPNG
jgi:hypothetical protein